jgi:gamma-glutamyl phosphate reductase
MLEALGHLPIGQFSAGALVAIIVITILRGGLVPRQLLVDKQADLDKWREAAEKWQLTATQLGISIEKLLVHAEMTQHAIVDIRELAQQRASSDLEA